MMQIIRDKAQGVVAWVIVGMVAFVLCFWGVSGYISSDKSTVLAKVNGKEITANEVNEIYNRWLRVNAAQKDFDIAQIDPNAIKQQITMAIANQAATIGTLQRDGMTVSDAMVIDAIRSKNELQEDGKFSIERYKLFLQQANVSEAEFETAVRDQLLINQLQLAVLVSSFATKQEAERFVQLKNQTRDFGYSVISAENFQKNARITDAAIEEFYNTHKQQFVMPDKIQVEYIELSLEDLMKQVQITEKNLQEYYDNNKQAFTEPRRIRISHIMISAPTISEAAQNGTAQKQITELYAKLQQGEKFSELARKYSEDKQSAIHGGDLGWASNNDDYPAEVFALAKAGDYTKPIQSDYGWHIFKLEESKGGSVKSFAAAKAAIAQRYKRDEAERLFSSKGDELANLAFENPTALTAASEKLNLPIQTSAYFTRQGGPGIAASSNVLQAAFSEDVFVQNYNSALIRLNDDNYLVLRVKEKQASREQTVEEVKEDITQYLKRIAARDEAKQIGEELIAVIKQTNNPNKAAGNQKLEWIVKSNVERDDKNINREVLMRAFSIPKPAEAQGLSTTGFSLPSGDFVVISVTKVKNGVLENATDSNLLETMGRHIANSEGQIDYASVQQDLIEQAKIKYYNGA